MPEHPRIKAAEAMSREVIAVGPDTPLSQVARLMVQRRVSGVPVVDAEARPIGMLTEGDLLRRVETGTEGKPPGWLAALFAPGRLAQRYIETHARRVGEVMTADVVCVAEDAPLEDVVTLMQRRRVKRLPVVSNGRLAGIISRSDLVRVLADALGAPAVTSDDAAIRTAVLEEMGRQPWAHRRAVTVAIENGVVLLDGCVFDMRERDAMQVLAEAVPGVRDVANQLVCVEVTTGTVVFDPDDPTMGPGTMPP